MKLVFLGSHHSSVRNCRRRFCCLSVFRAVAIHNIPQIVAHSDLSVLKPGLAGGPAQPQVQPAGPEIWVLNLGFLRLTGWVC